MNKIRTYGFNSSGGVSSIAFIDVPGGEAATPTWGGITGTLSDQSDLQTVLNTISTKAATTLLSSAAFTISSLYAISSHGHAYASLTGLPTLGTAASTAVGNYASSTHVHPPTVHDITAHDFPGGGTVYLNGDGAFSTPAGGGGSSPISTVKLSTIRFTTTTSSFPLTELKFTVSNTIHYALDFGVVYASRISSAGLRLGMTYPQASSFSANVRIPSLVATGTDSEIQGNIIVSGSSVVAPSTPLASTMYWANVYGSIVPSANGTLQLTYATEVAGQAISTFVGSYGVLTTL